jgi:hypothetical protein
MAMVVALIVKAVSAVSIKTTSDGMKRRVAAWGFVPG